MNEATTACQLAEPDLKAKSKVWVLALCVPLCCLLERSVIGKGPFEVESLRLHPLLSFILVIWPSFLAAPNCGRECMVHPQVPAGSWVGPTFHVTFQAPPS